MFSHLRALAALRGPAARTTVLEDDGDVVDGKFFKICNDGSTDCFQYDGAGKIVGRSAKKKGMIGAAASTNTRQRRFSRGQSAGGCPVLGMLRAAASTDSTEMCWLHPGRADMLPTKTEVG